MDVQLGNLIEKLRQEGVEEARRTSEELLEKARAEADGIIAAARTEAEKIVAGARTESDRLQESGELALRQAARDGELLLKSRIADLFDRVLRRSVASALSPDTLRQMIVRLVEAWGEGAGIEIVLSESDRAALEEQLFAALGEDLKDTVTLTVSDEVAHGFRIGREGEDAWYDCTDESIAGLLRMYLQPRLKEILDGADG